MEKILKGKVVWKFGDNFNSDLITEYPKYASVNDEEGLAKICMAKFDPEFRKRVKKGDFLIAGKNFGFGHPHSQAHKALKAVGVSGLIAESVARGWFRTAINMGIPVLTCKDISDSLDVEDYLEINLASGEIKNLGSSKVFHGRPLADFMLEIVGAGGLIPYLRKRLAKAADSV